MMQKRSGGQSVIEYLLFIAVVIVVVIAFVRPGGNFYSNVEYYLDGIPGQIQCMTDSINFERGGGGPPSGL